jgi:predicted DNA-binding transcriptional regulator AlpA
MTPQNKETNMSALLGSIAVEPQRIADLSQRQLPALLAELASIQTLVAARLAIVVDESRKGELLKVTEAAKLMGTTVDWLYRHADDFPFVRRLGPGQLRFDRAGLDAYMERSVSRGRIA